MDGDVDGADVQGDDPFDLPFGQVRQGDIISQQEAETGIVVLKIHGFAHALGELVDEAEHAVVGAGAGRVHQIALKLQPQIAALRFVDGHFMLAAVRPAQPDAEPAVIGVELVIQYVDDFIAVY